MSTLLRSALSPGATLTDLSDETLFRALAEADEAEKERIRDVLVRRHTGLVKWLVSRYSGRGVDAEELTQVGFVGLMNAINRFDPDHGAEFGTFAKPTVQGEIRRYFRDKRRWIQLPRRLQETKAVIRKHTEELTHDLGRAPTVAELATHLCVDEELVLEAMTADDTFSLTSLDSPVAADDVNAVPLVETLGGVDQRFDLLVDFATMRPLVAALPERERTILALRFFDNLTQAEIGERLGISQMHVSRLLSRTLAQLRTQMQED
jgi:RNA polymerase sigma-B factor